MKPSNWRIFRERAAFTEYVEDANHHHEFYIRHYNDGTFKYQDASSTESGWEPEHPDGDERTAEEREIWRDLPGVASFREAITVVTLLARMA